jgi:hypothetical protein
MKLLFKRISDSLLSYIEVYNRVSKDRIGTIIRKPSKVKTEIAVYCYYNTDNTIQIEGKNRIGTERLVKSFYGV